MGENDVAVEVDDGNCDRYVLFERLGLDAVGDVLGGGEYVHGRVLPFRKRSGVWISALVVGVQLSEVKPESGLHVSRLLEALLEEGFDFFLCR